MRTQVPLALVTESLCVPCDPGGEDPCSSRNSCASSSALPSATAPEPDALRFLAAGRRLIATSGLASPSSSAACAVSCAASPLRLSHSLRSSTCGVHSWLQITDHRQIEHQGHAGALFTIRYMHTIHHVHEVSENDLLTVADVKHADKITIASYDADKSSK